MRESQIVSIGALVGCTGGCAARVVALTLDLESYAKSNHDESVSAS